MRKLSTLCRKIHRYLTIPFVVLTLMVIVFTRNMPINNFFFRWQRVFMLGLAITGVFMFLYPYILKRNKRKDNSI
ncbi:MAG: hypothetical protein PHI72_09820 [Atribacterota bacterium]|nr:hypothetical protein [Atribacterota bacterium]MDD4896394.1 hypothetical protein [Atribacterota bacterium]MDD5638077.1 hypothetical protein [Atribacterota bacterium]